MADSTHCFSSSYRRNPEVYTPPVVVDPPFVSRVDHTRAFAPIPMGVRNGTIVHWAICAENHPEGDTEVFGPRGIIAIGQPLSNSYEDPGLARFLIQEHNIKAHPDMPKPDVILFARLTTPELIETRIPAREMAREVLGYLGSTPLLTPLLTELRQPESVAVAVPFAMRGS